MKDRIFNSIGYVMISLCGSFITIIFNFLFLLFKGEKAPDFESLFGQGEIIIICIPLCITAIYSFYLSKETKGFSGLKGLLFWITLLVVVICSFLYSLFTFVEIKHNSYLSLLSIFVLIWTALNLFASKQYEMNGFNTIAYRKDEEDKLEDKVNKLK